MTCEEWRNGYKQGFDDGYEKARRDLTDTKPVNPFPFPDRPIWDQPQLPDPYCKVCGMSMKGVMGYVCFNNKCPTKVTCGSNISYTYGTDAERIRVSADAISPTTGLHGL